MNAPLVSILIPCHNHAQFVRATLESLTAQTYQRLELLLIDDGSTDGSGDIIDGLREVLDGRFERVAIGYRENRGLAATQNELIAQARGEYLFFLASDDIALPGCIQSLVDIAETALPPPVLVCGEAQFIDSNGLRLFRDDSGAIHSTPGPTRTALFVEHCLRRRVRALDPGEFGSHSSFLFGNYIPIGLLIRRSAALQVGPYPPGLVLDDFFFWLKLSRLGRFHFTKQVLTEYRLHATNTSATRQAAMGRDAIRLLFEQKDYCIASGTRPLWEMAVANVVSLRNPAEVVRAVRAGVSPLAFLKSRIPAYAKRIQTMARAFLLRTST